MCDKKEGDEEMAVKALEDVYTLNNRQVETIISALPVKLPEINYISEKGLSKPQQLERASRILKSRYGSN